MFILSHIAFLMKSGQGGSCLATITVNHLEEDNKELAEELKQTPCDHQ